MRLGWVVWKRWGRVAVQTCVESSTQAERAGFGEARRASVARKKERVPTCAGGLRHAGVAGAETGSALTLTLTLVICIFGRLASGQTGVDVEDTGERGCSDAMSGQDGIGVQRRKTCSGQGAGGWVVIRAAVQGRG